MTDPKLEQLIKLLKGLEREGFFGSVTVQFKAGDVTLVRKEQTIVLRQETSQEGHVILGGPTWKKA